MCDAVSCRSPRTATAQEWMESFALGALRGTAGGELARAAGGTDCKHREIGGRSVAQRDASGRDGLRPSWELLVPRAKWGDLVATPRQETTGFGGGERKEGRREGV